MSEDHEEDRGLLYDLEAMSRRRALGLFGGLGLTGLLAACSSPSDSTASSASASTSATSSSASTTAVTSASGASSASSTSTSPAPTVATNEPIIEVPDETSGPYPADGSNGPDALDDSGIVRSDIRSSFGASSTTAPGVPLTIRLTVRNAHTGNAVKNAAVYLWHCDREGSYSIYQKISENYLRGVQATDSNGTVTFTSIFPGCYSGRWPHIHFEVYESIAKATTSGSILKTSQIALPQETCAAVYATSGYSQSASNLQRTSVQQDMVFGDDGGIHQIASMAGDAKVGFTASLTVGV